MTLVSITPGEPCRVRAYLCARGVLARLRVVDVQLNKTPNKAEVEEIRRGHQSFVDALEVA